MKQDTILILDLGGEQSAQIAREVRALGVYSEIHPHDLSLGQLRAMPTVRGIILNGGPNHIVDGCPIAPSADILAAGIPVLPVEYEGAQPWPQDAAARKAMLRGFAFDVCKAEPNWNMKNFIADQIELVKSQVGDKKVLLALSGGVDSSVVAALLLKAIGDQLVCVHVNHGLLRKGEPEQVVQVFRDNLGANLIYVDAVDRFLDKLAAWPSRKKSAKSLGPSSSGCLRRRPASWRASSSWHRAPFIQTLWRAAPRPTRW